jgi:hypothetical protein
MVSARNQRLLAEFDRAGLRPVLTVQPAGGAEPAAETRGDC